MFRKLGTTKQYLLGKSIEKIKYCVFLVWFSNCTQKAAPRIIWKWSKSGGYKCLTKTKKASVNPAGMLLVGGWPPNLWIPWILAKYPPDRKKKSPPKKGRYCMRCCLKKPWYLFFRRALKNGGKIFLLIGGILQYQPLRYHPSAGSQIQEATGSSPLVFFSKYTPKDKQTTSKNRDGLGLPPTQ